MTNHLGLTEFRIDDFADNTTAQRRAARRYVEATAPDADLLLDILGLTETDTA